MNLSVIIPAYGKEELLIRCLTSLDRNMQGDYDYEVCVVDDGSGLDENSVRQRVSPKYPLKWRSFTSVIGRSTARNEGIRSTTGDIIVFLDSDMETREGFIFAHIKSHREHPRTAVIGKVIWPKGGSFLRYIGSRGVKKLRHGETVQPWYYSTGNSSVRRCDLPGDNVFDETLQGWGGEDLDLGLKLHAAGLDFMYVPEALSYHNYDGDLSGHLHRTELYGRNTLPVLVERYPGLEKILRLDLMNSIVWRMVVHKKFFTSVARAANILDSFPLPALVFDYLTFAAYSRGWLMGRKS